ncbi:hypothetical protein [Lutibacter sp.]|uniref:hypothetical protein n=1 Tax=Lutibacter sp. TaxID=1925666 RepID=UPI0025B9B32F|nr:hypothetical protein [Lutibacter sp.]MCF6180498.1 hypothetical protein [Lutibacter sp.]
MEALKGENLIKELKNKSIKLTNYRVRFYSSNYAYTSVMLDKISIINVTYYENIKYLHFAIISFASIFIALKLNLPFQLPLALSVIFYLMYTFNKEKVVYINSTENKSIKFSVSGLSTNEIDSFIDEIEKQSFKLKEMIE